MNVESVWDYPRPPRLEPASCRIRIVHAEHFLAETTAALRILETSHPPVYYLPPAGLATELLKPSASRGSFCEFKGSARYWDVHIGDVVIPAAAWSYDSPSARYAALAGHLAFYASKVDECWVDEERVVAQAGEFYGGWITSNLRGPFKGPPGTRHW